MGVLIAAKKKALTIDLNPKSSRRLQLTEAYAQKYYKSKIKNIVDAEINGLEERPRYPIAIIKRNIQQAWDAESDEVKQEIMHDIQEGSSSSNRSPPVNLLIDRTPEEYATAIDCIPDAMDSINNSLAKQTGWIWTILGGGPDPRFGGQVRTVA
ncbi:hypothetical protein C0992_000488 [Termitomyces sp. T32_za158]|nr:hypothetical protein C0992_000488 [Termitomyces sp. T32_za158]